MSLPTIKQIQEFWEAHPLFTFESPYKTGSKDFFDWHHQVRSNDVDVYALPMYEFEKHSGERVLDVGCGIGWLCHQFAKGGAIIFGVDLTRRAVELTRQRLDYDSLPGTLSQTNAEMLPFADGAFDFVISAGVLHHTPHIAQALEEIKRVLKPGGRAMISLYYRHWLLSETLWPLTRQIIRLLFATVPGRDSFGRIENVSDLIRIYDGNTNPLGEAYTHQELKTLLTGFEIEQIKTHYFPMRFLPWRSAPHWLHALLDRHFGLMLYALVKKNSL